ncbi:tail fiber protein [Acinetobacter sp. WC-323]|uniref:phage tail protein n=1 Tax=Acinetobacter sp. WC-323 TaxID=903918 RepID=UPI00029E3E55|nr:phage tail protein [Acinetobacter sp. WC-323]EKU54404.1 tail fiber protein [Acinetobacter sp. WC-323]
MAAQYHSLFTEQGLNLLREAIQNGTKLGITHMSFGDGGGIVPEPNAAFISLVNEIYRVPLNRLAPSPNNPNWLEADAVIPSAVGGFNIREVGLWAEDILVAYANYPPTFKPSADQGTAQIKTIRIVLQIDNTANFELQIDASVVMATIQSVEDAKKEVKKYADNTKISICSDYNELKLVEKLEGRLVRTLQYYSHTEHNNGSATYKCTNNKWVLQPDGIFVSPEQFGAIGDGVTDDSSAFQECANFAYENNLKIIGESSIGYYITKDIYNYVDTDIAGLIFPSSENLTPNVYMHTKKPTQRILLSSLTGLNEGSSKVLGLPKSAVGKYIRISSTTDILTERYNPPTNNPYYKNTTFFVLNESGDICPELDINFDPIKDTGTIVEIIPEEKEINFNIGYVGTLGNGTYSSGQIIIKRDSTVLRIGEVSSSSQFRTLISVLGNNCKIYGTAKESQYEGYGYGLNISYCCDTFIYDFKATKCRTELDGRHAANVFVFNSKLNKAGSHWGNNFKFKNCEVQDIVYAGRNLSLEDFKLHGFCSIRGDVGYVSGRLYVRNLTAKSTSFLSFSSPPVADFFTKPRRLFDVIDIDGVNCEGDMQIFYGYSATPLSKMIAPRKINIKNIDAPNSKTLAISSVLLDQADKFSKSAEYSLENINTGGYLQILGRGFKNGISQYAYKGRILNCGRTHIRADASYFEEMEVIDTKVIAHNKVNISTPLGIGEYIYKNVIFDHDNSLSNIALINVETKKGMMNCEYRNNFSNAGGNIIFSIGCRARLGATNYPLPLKYFVDPTVFIVEN